MNDPAEKRCKKNNERKVGKKWTFSTGAIYCVASSEALD